jgi:hypothetical protein
MAIAFESYATDAVTSTSDTELSVTAPSGITDGDLLVAIALNTGALKGITPNAANGWTALGTQSADNKKLWVWYKKAASESGAYTFAIDAYAYCAVAILRFSGAKCAGAADFVLEVGGNATNDQTIECPTISTAVDASMVLWIGGANGNQTSTSCNRGSATERVDYSGEGWLSLFVWSEPIAFAGSVTGAVITKSGYGGHSAMSLAIQPVGGQFARPYIDIVA